MRGFSAREGGARMVGNPVVSIIMGSASDWETMRHAAETLDRLGIANERRVISGPPHAGPAL